ncbi:MAG: AAA family ATPase [Bacteroidales bacterium]|nr:AAA family ATPase [Bacteroidales bacterium]
MNEKNNNLINAFQDGFDSDIHIGRLFVVKYDKLYHQYNVSLHIDIEEFWTMLKDEYKLNDENILLSYKSSKDKKINQLDKDSSQNLVEIKKEFLIDFNAYHLNFYYSDNNDKAIVDNIISKTIERKPKAKHKNKFYMVARSRRSEYGFELKKFKIDKHEINIEELYNDDFSKVNKRIHEFVQEKKQNGIVMLHGKYGTGKSTYIRYLMQNSKNRFIFMPNYMVHELSSPEFMPFLSNYENSVLVLEDCEDILRPRSMGNRNEALVNLLNLGDGLLSDALAIKLICTFNADLKKIEPAILRKGRLIARYEFEPLNVKKAEVLAKKSGIDMDVKQPITLAELFNYNKENFDKKSEGKHLGFGVVK